MRDPPHGALRREGSRGLPKIERLFAQAKADGGALVSALWALRYTKGADDDTAPATVGLMMLARALYDIHEIKGMVRSYLEAMSRSR